MGYSPFLSSTVLFSILLCPCLYSVPNRQLTYLRVDEPLEIVELLSGRWKCLGG